MVEEIIGRLPYLTGSQLERLEDELRRERQRRASSEGGGEGATQIHEGTAPPVTEVLECRPHEDGYLQLELRRYIRRDGSARERGPYWYFQFYEGGKRKKLYWTCVGSVDCFRLRTVRGMESSATNEPDLPTSVSPRSYPAGQSLP